MQSHAFRARTGSRLAPRWRFFRRIGLSGYSAAAFSAAIACHSAGQFR
jgi:hypothetical protein